LNRPVTIRAVSPDVIHGFIVAGTNVNTMVIPGYVAEIRTEFSRPGEHLMPCHEYCGLGHSEMWSMVRVLPAEELVADADGKVSCEIPR
jgi:cytochrome c oxidase subunit 2